MGVLLEHKNAVIYGAGGSIGGAVAGALAREGARVFLTGRPISTGATTHFLTARAAGRRMAERGAGVILTLSASAVRAHVPGVYVGGSGVACAAIESLTKQLSAELGPHGVRVNCLRSEGIPESWEGVWTEDWSGTLAEIEAQIKARSLLGRATTLADVGNAAVFLASDLAGATTGTVFDLTSGTVVD